MRDYLHNLRKEKQLSQKTVAAQMGISSNYYMYIENGSRQTDMAYSIMEKLASAFEVPVQCIIDAEREYVQKRDSEAD